MDELGWTLVAWFTLVTVNWAIAVYRSVGNPFAVAVLVVYYLMLLLRVYCGHAVNRAPPGPRRRRLEAAVAVLTSILISIGAGKVAADCWSVMHLGRPSSSGLRPLAP